MSVASQDVYLNLTRPLTVIGSGGGGSVNSVVGGANISTSGTTSVTVALQADLTSISSVDFTDGGAITGLSTINGAPVGVASLPANPAFSSVTINAGSASTIANIIPGVENSDPTVAFISGTSTSKGQFIVKSEGTEGGYAAITYGPSSNLFNNYISLNNNLIEITAVGGNNISLAADETSIGRGLFSVGGSSGASISSLTVSSIGGAAYPPAPPVNATFSTIGLSSIGAIVNSSASTIQTFNTVIGNMRIQGGSVVGATGGTTVNWATAFTTVPIVLATVEGTIGASVVATVQGAGENSANFSISAGGTGEIIDYLAIGGA